MKKAIALIPFVARRRRRTAAKRGAKVSAPALLGAAAAGAGVIVRRRRRSAAGFDASASELGGDRPAPQTAPPTAGDATPERAAQADPADEAAAHTDFVAETDAPANGQGRPSTLEGDPADSVPAAGIAGVGEDSVVPETGTEDPLVREAEAAAAAEAGAIGGDVPETPPSAESDFTTEPETRPSEEHSGSAFESFTERES